MIIFGIVGYLFKKFDYEGAPLTLAFVLGPMVELNLRQSLLLSKGSFFIFFTRPISATFIIIAIILCIIPLFSYFFKIKEKPRPPVTN
jgi:putative tricarboxylic transport membrane protein